MTIVASGQLNMSAIAAEYGAGATDSSLGAFYRGAGGAKWVRANSGDNGATNLSAGVPATSTDLKFSHFYGQAKGWQYTNTTTRIVPSAQTGNQHYHCHVEFGSDWLGANGTNWPCYYVNNAAIVSTTTQYYALVIYGRQDNGPFTFTNNNEIQAAGGQPNGGAGQHACYIYNSENASYPNRPIIVNNYAFRGGGGAGGYGGQGGTGGQGYYNYTARDPSTGDVYATGGSGYLISFTDGGAHGICSVYWAGLIYQQYIPPSAPITQGAYTYYTGSLRMTSGDQAWYGVFRQWTATQYTNGGAGGGGGNGGRGIGYNLPNQGGNGGAPGAGGDTNAGSGGYGGTGGTGGSWGEWGQTGATGATGNGGNAGGGSAGAGGQGGGAPGYAIYAATKWGCANNNTLNGPIGGGVANT